MYRHYYFSFFDVLISMSNCDEKLIYMKNGCTENIITNKNTEYDCKK